MRKTMTPQALRNLPKVQVCVQFMEDIQPPFLLVDVDGEEIGICVSRKKLETYSRIETVTSPSAVITGLLTVGGVEVPSRVVGYNPCFMYNEDIQDEAEVEVEKEPITSLFPENKSAEIVKEAIKNMQSERPNTPARKVATKLGKSLRG